MKAYIVLTRVPSTISRTIGVYRSGETIAGEVRIDASSDQVVSAVNVNFVGRMQVDIRSRNPTLSTTNTAQHTFFRQTKTLWQGAWRARGHSKHTFELVFPDDPDLLPTYYDTESPYLSGVVGKGSVEYYLEVQVLSPNLESHTSARQTIDFRTYRYAERPNALPAKLPVEFTCQSARLTGRKKTMKDRFRTSSKASSSDPIVHFNLNFVHSTEAILGQTLHLFMDLTPDPQRTTSLEIPPVFLKALRVVLVAVHSLHTSYGSDTQNGVPTKWSWKRVTDVLNYKASEWNKMILIYDKCDLRPHFRDLKIPGNALPTIKHANLKLRYHFEITAEFECAGKTFKPEGGVCQDIKLLAQDLAPSLRPSAATEEAAHSDWGTFSHEDRCPVCHLQLPNGPESARQGHLRDCLASFDKVRLPIRPMSVLIVDDYNDCTSPFAVAYMSHLRKAHELFAKCIGNVVWAEHEAFDVLELPVTADTLRSVLSDRSINWTRPPKHHYWEAEELHAFDYILYAGQNIQAAQTFLQNSPPAFATQPDGTPSPWADKRATLMNMANLIPRPKWPHDARDMETAWTQEATPEARLERQFEVIKDCCLQFTWQMFNLALPGFDRAANPNRAELDSVVPVELHAPLPLPPEMPSERDARELPGSEVPIRRLSTHSQYSELTSSSQEELYSNPRRHSNIPIGYGTHLQPPNEKRPAARDSPANVYELAG